MKNHEAGMIVEYKRFSLNPELIELANWIEWLFIIGEERQAARLYKILLCLDRTQKDFTALKGLKRLRFKGRRSIQPNKKVVKW